MKKILLPVLLTSLVSSAAFAAPAPVLDIESGVTNFGVNYDFSTKESVQYEDLKVDLKSSKAVGVSLSHSFNDNFALQYSFDPITVKNQELVGGINVDKINVDFYRLQGIYKINENINTYAGIDSLKTYSNLYSYRREASTNRLIKSTVVSSKTKLGVSAGVTYHTKVADKTSAFASVGFGNVVKHEYKLGFTHKLNDNLDTSLFYSGVKLKGDAGGEDAKYSLKHKGLNLAVNYKF